MKNKIEIQQDRDKIRSIAERVVNLFGEVNEVMKGIPHRNGIAIKSLKSKSQEYLSHLDGSVRITYRHSNGKLYEITYNEVKEE